MRYTGITVTTAAETTRTIINHEVYHSVLYKRIAARCSCIVQFVMGNQTLYGRIVKYILQKSVPLALLKIMDNHRLNICQQSSPPSKMFLKKLSSEGRLAHFYIPVEELDELIAVECSSFRQKCIFIDSLDFHEGVVGWLVPIMQDYRLKHSWLHFGCLC